MTQYIIYLWHCIKLYYYVRLWDWKTPSFLKLHPCHAVQTLSSWSKSSSVTIWIKLCGITFSWCCLCFGHLRSKIQFKNLKSFVWNFDFGGVCMLYISTAIPLWTLQLDFLCFGSYMYVLHRHKQGVLQKNMLLHILTCYLCWV